MSSYVLALDQGTTSSRAILFDRDCRIRGAEHEEFQQIFPQPGWVEHDPEAIWSSQLNAVRSVMENNGVHPSEITAIGITNQRETTVVWNRKTGKPVYNAIVWQDRRTAGICDELKSRGLEQYVREHTGLVIDAYFSGTKIKWILDHVPQAGQLAEKGDLLFGTVDSWLIWKLTNGKRHITEVSNASRTMIYNIQQMKWDPTLLAALNIPESMLPEVYSSSEVYGVTDGGLFEGMEIPISGMAGDQQAAMFGQACLQKGMAKNTYGTGCFMLMNTGTEMRVSGKGLLTTIAWKLDREVTYALEGSIFVGGAVIQWLRDGLGIIETAQQTEEMAMEIEDSAGVVVVPAFTGLGAPHWDMYARGAIYGLTRGTDRRHIVRAALESIAFQSVEVLKAMESDTGIQLKALRVDGGASTNDFLMQFQSDILGVPVERPEIVETTALGAAYLAGLAVGFYKKEQMVEQWHLDRRFTPKISSSQRVQMLEKWESAVEKSKNWIKAEKPAK